MQIAQNVATVDFTAKGYHLIDQFLSADVCAELLQLISTYRQNHEVPEIYRPAGDRPLRYSVIDGKQIRVHLTDIHHLYQRVNSVVNQITGEQLVPLEDEKVACNINITKPGGTYRWHYDRNALTAILYLNNVDGGETDCYPNYRLFLKNVRFSGMQQWADRLFQTRLMRRISGKLVVVKPRAGTLFLMRGSRSLHSVRPVKSDFERINIIMSYDQPGMRFVIANKLDSYLYQEQSTGSPQDPNYK